MGHSSVAGGSLNRATSCSSAACCLHSILCFVQLFFWHAVVQYLTSIHDLHVLRLTMPPSSLPHSAQQGFVAIVVRLLCWGQSSIVNLQRILLYADHSRWEIFHRHHKHKQNSPTDKSTRWLRLLHGDGIHNICRITWSGTSTTRFKPLSILSVAAQRFWTVLGRRHGRAFFHRLRGTVNGAMKAVAVAIPSPTW